MDEIERKTMQDIKNYVKSLDRPDNEVYQKNSLLIMSCFSKAIEFIEENAKLRQTVVISSVCDCKVCGKPFGDKLSLYEHYDEEHNKQTDL